MNNASLTSVGALQEQQISHEKSAARHIGAIVDCIKKFGYLILFDYVLTTK